MPATSEDKTGRPLRPVRKRAKIVDRPAISGAFSGESSVEENDSESDFDAPKKGKRPGKSAKGNAATKSAKVVTKRPSKSVKPTSAPTIASKLPPRMPDSSTSGHEVLSVTFAPIMPQAARLTQLPYDILWEILAYYPTIPNWEVERPNPVLNPKYLQRYQVLRALSQTCRALRFQCHPHLWEHIQACLLKEDGNYKGFYMQVGEALQKQSQILVSALPELQPLVRTMTVSLTRYQVNKILPAFAKALGVLPNLHTLRICHAHSQISAYLRSALEGHVFPQITTVVLPSCAYNILRSCPNVKDVTNVEDLGTELAGVICKECPRVERVANFGVRHFTLKRLAKALPKLRSFGLNRGNDVKEIEALSLFPELSTIEWVVHPWLPEPSSKEEKIKAATALLRQSRFQGDKWIVIHYPCKDIMPGGGAGALKEEDGHEEIFKLPQEVKQSIVLDLKALQ